MHTIPLRLDFSSVLEIDVDITIVQQQPAAFGATWSMYFDTAGATTAQTVTATVDVTGERIIQKGRQQSWLPILSLNPTKIRFVASSNIAELVYVFLCDCPMPVITVSGVAPFQPGQGILLEDLTGFIELEDGSGTILLES